MTSTCISGVIWGDEGKGKIIDVLNEKASLVIKYNGGCNAGATYVIDGKKYELHHLPSGVLRDKRALIAQGAIINPLKLIKEISNFKKINLGIDPRTHIIFPWHIAMDIARENKLGKNKIGTTAQGIGPTYEDKMSRVGIRFYDLIGNKNDLERKIKENYEIKQKVLKEVYNFEIMAPEDGKFGAKLKKFSLKEIVQLYSKAGEKLKPYLSDVSEEVMHALEKKEEVFFQGSQGFLLDIAYGNYPKVTSSSPSVSSIPENVGVSLKSISDINAIGVLKAYITKVGSGPVVTCLDKSKWPVDENVSENIANKIRKEGHEYGTTTGRARRVGWLDLVVANYSTKKNGFTQIALTKLDTLADIEKLKICVAYMDQGKITQEYKGYATEWLNNVKPVYREINGFSKQKILNAKTFDQLPENAKEYVKTIESVLKVPVTIISTGPDREQIIWK